MCSAAGSLKNGALYTRHRLVLHLSSRPVSYSVSGVFRSTGFIGNPPCLTISPVPIQLVRLRTKWALPLDLAKLDSYFASNLTYQCTSLMFASRLLWFRAEEWWWRNLGRYFGCCSRQVRLWWRDRIVSLWEIFVTQFCLLVFRSRFRLEKVGNLTFVKKTILQTCTYLFLEFFSAL